MIWLSALQGKMMFPNIMGSSWVQWSCAAMVAILVPIGTLLALRTIANPEKRRSGLGLLLACVSPLIINLTTYGVGGPMMARSVAALESLNDRDTEMIAVLTRQAVKPEDFGRRKKAAWALYTLFGVRAVWRDDSGTLVEYSPGEQEEAAWQKRQHSNSELARSKNRLVSQLQQFPWLFALNLGSFTIILFGGLAWQTYHRKSGQIGDGNRH